MEVQRALLILAINAVPFLGFAQLFHVESIGAFAGTNATSEALGINNAGQVVGFSSTLTSERAVMWTRQDGLVDLGSIAGFDGFIAHGISQNGIVAGTATAQSIQHAFRWDPVNGMVDIGDLTGGFETALGFDVNDSGRVVGWLGGEGGWRGSVHDPGGPMYDIGVLPGGQLDWSIAYAVNNHGTVVGRSFDGGYLRAVLWDETNGLRLMGDAPGVLASIPYDINDQGQVVGGVQPDDFSPFIWDELNGMRLLDDDPDWSWGEARAINELGQVVGGPNDPYLWTEDSGFVRLNEVLDIQSAGWRIKSVYDINDHGVIVGVGEFDNGADFGVVLTPVPEPVTIVSLGLGAAFVIRRRRRARP